MSPYDITRPQWVCDQMTYFKNGQRHLVRKCFGFILILRIRFSSETDSFFFNYGDDMRGQKGQTLWIIYCGGIYKLPSVSWYIEKWNDEMALLDKELVSPKLISATIFFLLRCDYFGTNKVDSVSLYTYKYILSHVTWSIGPL